MRQDRERLASDIVDAWLAEKKRWQYKPADHPHPGYHILRDGVKRGWLPAALEWREGFDAMVNRACPRAIIEVINDADI